MIGRVELRGLRCAGRHGATDGSASEQVFLVDVAVELDLGPVANSDAYADVVDLSALAHVVREIVGGQPRLLLETVAVHAARLVLERFSAVQQVRLRLAKPDPPGLDAAEEAVEVSVVR
jgi:7,8-dihydroneopterin aldolase/epimerase/oxygenase